MTLCPDEVMWVILGSDNDDGLHELPGSSSGSGWPQGCDDDVGRLLALFMVVDDLWWLWLWLLALLFEVFAWPETLLTVLCDPGLVEQMIPRKPIGWISELDSWIVSQGVWLQESHRISLCGPEGGWRYWPQILTIVKQYEDQSYTLIPLMTIYM